MFTQVLRPTALSEVMNKVACSGDVSWHTNHSWQWRVRWRGRCRTNGRHLWWRVYQTRFIFSGVQNVYIL